MPNHEICSGYSLSRVIAGRRVESRYSAQLPDWVKVFKRLTALKGNGVGSLLRHDLTSVSLSLVNLRCSWQSRVVEYAHNAGFNQAGISHSAEINVSNFF